jgi:hypothetical protein
VPGIILRGKRRPVRKADNLTVICEPIFQKMWETRSFTTLWDSRMGIILPFFILNFKMLEEEIMDRKNNVYIPKFKLVSGVVYCLRL